MSSIINPLKSLVVAKHHIPRHGGVPNTSISNKPMLIYRNAFSSSASASDIEAHLNRVGVVEPQWRYTMYSQMHFHSTSHEVLCVFSGQANLRFGGNEAGTVDVDVSAGDVIVLPAGVGHKLVDDRRSGFEMVGSYPKDCHWDMCYGRDDEDGQGITERIKALSWFKRDPIYGDEGPVLEV